MTARRPTPTIPQMLDRANREVRLRRINHAVGNALAAISLACAMGLTGTLLASIAFDRWF